MAVGDSIRIVIDESRQIVIGRAPMVDAVVMAPSVGRNVVGLELTPVGVVIRDLGSGGGSAVQVSGVRTNRPEGPLPDGSLLWIGRVGFRVAVSSND
jgi:pSer/pThr/pTyr-binding forkhead associated (FHA) protein